LSDALPVTGRLESIWIAGEATERPHRVERAVALRGYGLEGDRYAAQVGTFSGGVSTSTRDLTLISADAVEHARAAVEDGLLAGDLRRNLVVSGLELPELQRARLRIGEVLIEVTGTCPPCGHLDRLLELDSQALLAGRGGMRASILQGGELVAGAPITIARAPRRLP